MLLDVSQAIRNEGRTYSFHQEERVDPQDIHGENVTFDNPVLLEGQICFEDQCLRMTGTFTATAHSRCCNCLQEASATLSVPFEENFYRVSRYDELTDPFETDRWTFEGSNIDTAHLALTIALLNLPMRFLCRPDCDGYKQYVVRMDIADSAEETSNPFSVLKDMLNEHAGG